MWIRWKIHSRHTAAGCQTKTTKNAAFRIHTLKIWRCFTNRQHTKQRARRVSELRCNVDPSTTPERTDSTDCCRDRRAVGWICYIHRSNMTVERIPIQRVWFCAFVSVLQYGCLPGHDHYGTAELTRPTLFNLLALPRYISTRHLRP